MKKKKNDIFGVIFVVAVLIWIIISVLVTAVNAVGFVAKNFSAIYPFLIGLLIFVLLYICFFGKGLEEIREEQKEIKDREKKAEEAKKKAAEEEMVRKYNEEMRRAQFHNKPEFLSEEQSKRLFNTTWNISHYLFSKYFLDSLDFPDFTPEEKYTALFINKDVVPLDVKVKDSHFDLGVVIIDNDNFEIKNENLLEGFLRPEEPEVKPVVKKKTSSKVKKLRKQRKLEATAKANGTKIKNGKEYQPKNYDFLAKEWINSNMGYINKLLQDSIQNNPHLKKFEVTIPKDKLPEDHETWKLIGKKLKEDDEISRYIVSTDNIKLIVSAD